MSKTFLFCRHLCWIEDELNTYSVRWLNLKFVKKYEIKCLHFNNGLNLVLIHTKHSF